MQNHATWHVACPHFSFIIDLSSNSWVIRFSSNFHSITSLFQGHGPRLKEVIWHQVGVCCIKTNMIQIYFKMHLCTKFATRVSAARTQMYFFIVLLLTMFKGLSVWLTAALDLSGSWTLVNRFLCGSLLRRWNRNAYGWTTFYHCFYILSVSKLCNKWNWFDFWVLS